MTETSTPIQTAAAAPPPPPRRRWVRRVVVALVTLAVVAGGYGVYWWAEVQTYHLFQIQSGVLYRDGNRGMREFRHALDQTGARTVVTLVDDDELNDPRKPQFRQEADYCRDHGIKQVRIPVKLGGWPTSDQLLQFLGVVAEPANRPVLIHCAQGVRRTGMFMAAYQLTQMDRSRAWAHATVQAFGHKPRDTDDVQAFIDNYDPASATIPTTMPTVSPE